MASLSIWLFDWVFIVSVVGLLSFCMFVFWVGGLSQDCQIFVGIEYLLVFRLFFFPLIWLCIFNCKKRGEGEV